MISVANSCSSEKRYFIGTLLRKLPQVFAIVLPAVISATRNTNAPSSQCNYISSALPRAVRVLFAEVIFS